ncbi:MAG: trypsin-like peptidase domain-containing protein [Bacteroidia bacterium]|nr:trypsin-like peptidase domain-containing protein [Bacteroidia bacterium]
MHRFFIILILTILTFSVQAQDIIYFDKKGKATTQEEAYYYRKKETGNTYKSVYINGGSTYFEGEIPSASNTDENLNKYIGKCKWYYKNGNLKSSRNFNESGVEDGQTTLYYESGKVWKEIDYIKGEIKENRYVEYSEDGRVSRIFEENFNNNNNEWDLYSSDKSISKIKNGVFELESYTKSGTARYISLPINSEDFTIESTLNLEKLVNEQKVGIIFGFKDWDNYNYFLLSNGGMYIGYVYEGISADKVEGMFASSFQKGKKNSIKLITTDDKMIFTINGEVQYTCARFSLVGSNIGFVISGKGSVTIDDLICKEINYKNSSVSVSKSDYEVKATGSGILISEDGYIITNEHVINGANKIQVELTSQGLSKLYSAVLVQKDADNDLAILKINDESFKPVEKLKYSFKENGIVEVGASAFTIGFPLALSGMGKEAKYTDGKISSKTGYNGSLNSFQTSIPVQPGNSGGPVFNEKGELIGLINASVRETDNVSYAIKLNYIKNLIETVGETAKLPDDKSIQALTLEEKIKLLTNYVTLIKIK